MRLTRNLSLGTYGEDVLAVKRKLLELGYYASEITDLKRSIFGADTRRAVLAFQAANGLVQDGVVGPITYAVLFGDAKADTSIETTVFVLPRQIPAEAAEQISESLTGESQTRRDIVLDALGFAADPDEPGTYPLSLYIRGGNLYNADLSPNVITLARIAYGAARQPAFYDGGRREMMERAVRLNSAITGADCSGGIVGLLRHAKAVSAGFDCSADGFSNSARIVKIDFSALRPGDFLHKPGHIGLYAGGGYAVEWMGGAYGCQLTKLKKRRGWNYVKSRMDTLGEWTGGLGPNYYKD